MNFLTDQLSLSFRSCEVGLNDRDMNGFVNVLRVSLPMSWKTIIWRHYRKVIWLFKCLQRRIFTPEVRRNLFRVAQEIDSHSFVSLASWIRVSVLTFDHSVDTKNEHVMRPRGWWGQRRSQRQSWPIAHLVCVDLNRTLVASPGIFIWIWWEQQEPRRTWAKVSSFGCINLDSSVDYFRVLIISRKYTEVEDCVFCFWTNSHSKRELSSRLGVWYDSFRQWKHNASTACYQPRGSILGFHAC